MEMYEVGGCVRDELLGIPSKDIDFTVVLSDEDLAVNYIISDDVDPFIIMVNELQDRGFKIFLESPEFLTVRAQFPSKEVIVPGSTRNFSNPKLTADFVLARKEGKYTDGRRPDMVEVGTLEDDLARRDFTMNAIAKDSAGNLIDPFGGIEDINRRMIRAVGDPKERMMEDALRAVRALRFSVTKKFRIEGELMKILMFDTDLMSALSENVSDERIQVELSKMLRFDTLKTLDVLEKYKGLTYAMLSGSVSLDATMKQKGRGK